MPIDYSKWDSLVVSDDSEVEQPEPPKKAKAKPHVTQSAISKKDAGGEKAAARRAVELPVELWLRIFYFNSGPDPKMVSIQYELGTLEFAGRLHRLMLVMSFDRFDATDRKRCIFTQDKDYLSRNLPTEDAQKVRFETWKQAMDEYLGDAPRIVGRPDLPSHIIMLKSRANDTIMPKLLIDHERRELSFEWYGMFHAFLRETAVYMKRNEKIDSANPGLVGQAQRLMARDPPRAMEMMMSIYNSNIGVRKQVRRERLKKQLRGWSGLNLNDKLFQKREAQALQTVADRESEADVTETAEDANELRWARKAQEKSHDLSDEANQDSLRARAMGEDTGFNFNRPVSRAVTQLPNFVDLVRWWDDSDAQ
ncbi:hypothetical protein LTR37_019720 [Vermiconidia calcicola]|uniref:Uncharacterized protein n=1 Tax=Vermiconidia calcicola TaxID=1690605 RepID=A0ACC3MDD6_9PEZI|nr:hypothetical protein LTR37_019720 [Vermiconidia calcicola]